MRHAAPAHPAGAAAWRSPVRAAPADHARARRIFSGPLTVDSMSTTVFGGGAVAHVFKAHP
jgi:hypothetical protein